MALLLEFIGKKSIKLPRKNALLVLQLLTNVHPIIEKKNGTLTISRKEYKLNEYLMCVRSKFKTQRPSSTFNKFFNFRYLLLVVSFFIIIF